MGKLVCITHSKRCAFLLSRPVDSVSLPAELDIYLSFSPFFFLLLIFCRRGRSHERVNRVYVTEAKAVLMLMKAD